MRIFKMKVLLLIIAILGLVSCDASPAPLELHVSAAASLQESATELAELFMQAHPQVTIRLNFAGSNQLQQQIVEGLPADLFLSAHVTPYRLLTEAGFVNQGAPFAQTPVILVASTTQINTIYDLANPDTELIFAGAEVPIGIYTDVILNKVDLNQPGFSDAVLANVISRAANVRQALLYVTLGESDATFVYRSDLTAATRDAVQIIELPLEYQEMGTFYLALIEQTDICEMAVKFYDFILSQAGREVLERHGFE